MHAYSFHYLIYQTINECDMLIGWNRVTKCYLMHFTNLTNYIPIYTHK